METLILLKSGHTIKCNSKTCTRDGDGLHIKGQINLILPHGKEINGTGNVFLPYNSCEDITDFREAFSIPKDVTRSEEGFK